VLVAFGGGAVLLLMGRQGDHRPTLLGGFFLLLANTFADRFVADLARATAPPLRDWIVLALGADVQALSPFLLWRFAAEFPHAPTFREQRWLRLANWIAAASGVLLLSANLWLRARLVVSGQRPAELSYLAVDRPGSLFYPVLLVLMLAALAVLLLRARRADRTSRRRVRLFATAVALGAGPVLATALLSILWPAFGRLLDESATVYTATVALTIGGLLTLPFTTAYAVLVHRVLDVRLIARQALRYLFARASVVVLALVPSIALLAFLYLHRHRPVIELLYGPRLPFLLAGTVLGVTAFRFRKPLLSWIDQRFFRERYDARRLLLGLAGRMGGSRDELDLARLLSEGIDRALHLEGVGLLVEDPARGLLVDPLGHCRPLDASSTLAGWLAAGRGPLELDLALPGNPARKLPEAERHWLVDTGFRLLVPLFAGDGALSAVLALGAKRSGLPFLTEDWELLQAIASNAALGLEALSARSAGGRIAPSSSSATGDALARECPSCARLFPPGEASCRRCGAHLVTTTVPYLLPGRFRLEERLGTGGMGVVYRATDLGLGRPVAIKTLLLVSPEHALRLRREARTAAAVSHPNLAAVFGLETWQGTPLLVFEYLEGGMLADRLDAGPLPWPETIALGVAMAGALARLHQADILHRDVKPSNIGYDREGTPKLTDFGIARLMGDLRREVPEPSGDERPPLPPTQPWNTTPDPTASRLIVGPLSYLSPEAIAGAPPQPAADLWSLALVLHECLTDERVFPAEEEPSRLMERIRSARIPDPREGCPDCPEALAHFLCRALDRDPERRPRSARAFARALAAAGAAAGR
jgi:hypothetical protein